jgi:hypothetical protein
VSETDFIDLLAEIRDQHDAAARRRRKWQYVAAIMLSAFILASYLVH